MSGSRPTEPLEITKLLVAWRDGSREAHDRLVEQVYPDLVTIARRHLRGERDRPLHTGDLVNEAYLKLLEARRIDWERRAQFFGIASRVMRRILVDMARARLVRERKAVLLAEPEAGFDAPVDALGVDQALETLESEGLEVEAEVVQLRFFGGLSIVETAAELGVSRATVDRAWARARTRLEELLGRA